MNMPATHVRVLQECVLNGPDHRSLGWLDVGDECIIAGGTYAEDCINDGLVERLSNDGEARVIAAAVEAEVVDNELTPDDFVKPSEAAVGKSGGEIPGRVSDLSGPLDGIAKSRGRRGNQK